MEFVSKNEVNQIVAAAVKQALGNRQPNVRQRTVELTLAQAASSNQVNTPILNGKTVKVSLNVFGTEQPVRLALKDTNGSDIVPFSSYKDWIKGTGEYFASMKTVGFTEKNVVVHIAPYSALSADFKAELLIYTQE